MKKFSLFVFVAAIFAFGLTGQASAEPQAGAESPKWSFGECDSNKTLSVENEALNQSVAETDGDQSTKPAETTEGG